MSSLRESVPPAAAQAVLGEVVQRTIAGAPEPSDRIVVNELGCELATRGADSLLFACTELSLFAFAADAAPFAGLPFYDALDLLARAACARAYAPSETQSS